MGLLFPPLHGRGARKPKNARPCQRVPLTATAIRTERCIVPVFIPKSLHQDLHQKGPSFPLPAEQNARQRQTAIRLPPIPVGGCCLDALPAHGQEVSRRDRSQAGILRDLVRPPASPFGEISFGQGLQTPGNPPEQMFPVSRSRFFLEHLPELLAQTRQAGPAQVLNLHQNRSVHSCLPLLVGQPQSPERSLWSHRQGLSEKGLARKS